MKKCHFINTNPYLLAVEVWSLHLEGSPTAFSLEF